jgi:hypothetical protein
MCIAIESQLDGSSALVSQHGRGGGDQGGLRLLAAEAAAHASALDGHLVHAPSQGMRDDLLDLGRVLGGAHDQHAFVLLRDGDGDLALEVEVILATHQHGALQPVRRLPQYLVRGSAQQPLCGQHGAARRQRRADVEDRGERLVLDARPPGGLARERVGVGSHRE